MANKRGQAYGLTTLCPIWNGAPKGDSQSHVQLTRECLHGFPQEDGSPMAKVPNTYQCRFYILDDVFYEGNPAQDDRLQSNYLVFSSNFHGELDAYLAGMWDHAEAAVRAIWKHCVAFERVKSRGDFIDYIKKCQVETTYFFVGSTDEPLDTQLKDLYLKQEFSRFAYATQGFAPEQLREAFAKWVQDCRPNESRPSWIPGSPRGATR